MPVGGDASCRLIHLIMTQSVQVPLGHGLQEQYARAIIRNRPETGRWIESRWSTKCDLVILLVPVVQAWRERRQVWTLLIAATAPIALIGCGLMLYNSPRFDSPFEFGRSYVLSGTRR